MLMPSWDQDWKEELPHQLAQEFVECSREPRLFQQTKHGDKVSRLFLMILLIKLSILEQPNTEYDEFVYKKSYGWIKLLEG